MIRLKTILEACWKGYQAIGMKKKGGKMVPNCVPKNEDKVPGVTSSSKPVQSKMKPTAGDKAKKLSPQEKIRKKQTQINISKMRLGIASNNKQKTKTQRTIQKQQKALNQLQKSKNK
jgi:hypothetical protein